MREFKVGVTPSFFTRPLALTFSPFLSTLLMPSCVVESHSLICIPAFLFYIRK